MPQAAIKRAGEGRDKAPPKKQAAKSTTKRKSAEALTLRGQDGKVRVIERGLTPVSIKLDEKEKRFLEEVFGEQEWIK